MMDALSIEAAEQAVQCGYPDGAGASSSSNSTGLKPKWPTPSPKSNATAENTALEVRVAADETERANIWKGRKSAFAAVGRISPDYIVQDGVIPRTALSEVLSRIAQLSAETGVRVANVFHAGDGNLHPLVLFDGSQPGATEQAEAVSGRIMELCLEHGGSITDEHGVGADKVKYMGRMFTEDDLDTMQRVRCAFDPAGICNPGKVFPTPRLCGKSLPATRSAPTGRRGLWINSDGHGISTACAVPEAAAARKPGEATKPTRSAASNRSGAPEPATPSVAACCAPPANTAARGPQGPGSKPTGNPTERSTCC